MPGLTVPQNRKRSVEVEDEGSSDDIASPQSVQSGGSKRARLDRDAFSESEGSVLPDSYRADRNGNFADEDYTEESHQPGSIIRVKLTNFVTYTAAEFHPGPSLNMIIGPNGTGKSTLVCAICLGLGWSPVNLGRAKELGEFVKHGSREAEIEIELAGGQQTKGRNPVIRRSIRKDGNKSNFQLNGRQTTQKEIVGLAKSFNIQIDNLCQFLPQDRVVEFAQLTPVELLRETQRAAAPEQMVQWHDRLKNFRREQKVLEVKQEQEQRHLSTMQAQQNARREDVERVQARQGLQIRAAALEKCKPYVNYRIGKARYDETKTQKKVTEQDLARLEKEVEPSLRVTREKESYRSTIRQVVNLRKANVASADKRADDIEANLRKVQDKIKELQAREQHTRDQEKVRRQDLNRAKQAINKIQREMEHAPIDFDPAEYNQRIRELSRSIRETQQRCDDIRNDQIEYKAEIEKMKKDRAVRVAERENMDSESGKQVARLRHSAPHVARAWELIQQNPDKFEREVYGPPLITCSLKDPRYAAAIESRVRGNDLLAFTATTSHDANTLQEWLNGEKESLSISIREYTRPLNSWQSPVSREQLNSLGLHGWLIDYLQGPEPVLSVLCDTTNLHKVGATLSTLSDAQYNALETSGKIDAWVEGKQIVQVTRRREYGVSSTSVRTLQPARLWTDHPVDLQAKRDLEIAIKEMGEETIAKKDLMVTLNKKYADLTAQGKDMEAEKNEIEKEKNAKQKAVSEFKALPIKLEAKENEKKRLVEGSEQTKQELLSIKSEIEQDALKMAQLTVDYSRAVDLLRNLSEKLIEAELRLIEASSEVDGLNEASSQVQNMLDQKKQDLERLKMEYSAIKREAMMLHKKAQATEGTLTDEELPIYEEFRDTATVEDLESEIDTVNTKLELIADAPRDAIRDYERRARDIAIAEEKLEELGRNLAEMQQDINDTRSQWEPELDALVSKISDGFSNNFEKIGCAGQVNVNKDEDFDLWSIQIQVKFREHEQLSILNSHRQSGGERAVSTIFYLMALQDLARSPFRVVDEINQGMDPRNERMVHERMVDIACKERTSQYFLITPKLLNDLKFHPKMKIHCIASGEYMPEDYHDLDFKALANMALRVRGAA